MILVAAVLNVVVIYRRSQDDDAVVVLFVVGVRVRVFVCNTVVLKQLLGELFLVLAATTAVAAAEAETAAAAAAAAGMTTAVTDAAADRLYHSTMTDRCDGCRTAVHDTAATLIAILYILPD